MPRWLQRWIPDRESLERNRWLRWLGPALQHPRLWHMHRGSVSLGIAIGAVTGLIPGPVQILLAILISIPLRANVLAAAAGTFVTNPLTFIPLYMFAFSMGTVVTGEKISLLAPPDCVTDRPRTCLTRLRAKTLLGRSSARERVCVRERERLCVYAWSSLVAGDEVL